MTTHHSHIDWSSVEKALEQGGALGYKMAVIETDKIFNKVIEEKNIPGDTMDKKIQNIQSVFSNSEKLRYARAIHDKIVSESNFEVSGEETQHLISAYYQAIIDVTQMRHGTLNIFTRLKFRIINLFRYKIARWIRNIAILFLLFFITVVLSHDTFIGRRITAIVVEFSQFMVYKFLAYAGIIILGVLVLIGLSYWWEQRRNRSKITIEE